MNLHHDGVLGLASDSAVMLQTLLALENTMLRLASGAVCVNARLSLRLHAWTAGSTKLVIEDTAKYTIECFPMSRA